MSQNDDFENASRDHAKESWEMEGTGFSSSNEGAVEAGAAPEIILSEPFTVLPEPSIYTYTQPEPPPSARIPHLGHLALLVAFLLFGFVCMGVAMGIGLMVHFDGVTEIDQIKTNVTYLLGSEALLYLVAFALSFFLFPLFWRKSFFAGIHWRGRTILHWGWLLALIAVGCFGLAMLVELLLPGPEHAPIEDLFRTPGAAWTMFFFGVTIAPFFEEIFFRGFLLPSLATAWDWIGEYLLCEREWLQPVVIAISTVVSITLAVFCEEKFSHRGTVGLFLLICFITLVLGLLFFWIYLRYQALGARQCSRPLDQNGHPQWSLAAMIVAAIPTSLVFALIHADQQGRTLGPFLLLVTVSLILCAVRLKLRSVAASTLVHACYNFLIFSVMLFSTGGFRHLDKM